MSHLTSSFGIATEMDKQRVSFFDTENLNVIHQLGLETDVLGVAIAPNGKRAIVTSFNAMSFADINLLAEPPEVITTISNVPAEGVAITSDSRFAVVVDGSSLPPNGRIASYSFNTRTIISSLQADAQAVAISPNGNGLVLTAQELNNAVHRFSIDNTGTLVDMGQEINTVSNPQYIVFSPTGQFAFTASRDTYRIGLLDTLDPNNVVDLGSVETSNFPRTILVSKNGLKLFVLTSSTVDIFSFNPQTTALTKLLEFNHGMYINTYYGVSEMALDPSETKLFISGGIIPTTELIDQLLVFSIDGTNLGTIFGISSDGGIGTASGISDDGLTRGIPFFS